MTDKTEWDRLSKLISSPEKAAHFRATAVDKIVKAISASSKARLSTEECYVVFMDFQLLSSIADSKIEPKSSDVN